MRLSEAREGEVVDAGLTYRGMAERLVAPPSKARGGEVVDVVRPFQGMALEVSGA